MAASSKYEKSNIYSSILYKYASQFLTYVCNCLQVYKYFVGTTVEDVSVKTSDNLLC